MRLSIHSLFALSFAPSGGARLGRRRLLQRQEV